MNSILYTQKLKTGKTMEEIEKDIRFLEIRFAGIDAEKYPLQKYFAEKDLGEAYKIFMSKTVGS